MKSTGLTSGAFFMAYTCEAAQNQPTYIPLLANDHFCVNWQFGRCPGRRATHRDMVHGWWLDGELLNELIVLFT